MRFHQVKVREYEQILVDNPSVSSGPPVGLGWGFDSNDSIFTVDEYEEMRPNRRGERSRGIIMSRFERESRLLQNMMITRSELNDMVKPVDIARKRRQSSKHNPDLLERVLDFGNSAIRVSKKLGSSKTNERQLRNAMKSASHHVKSSKKGGKIRFQSSRAEDSLDLRGFNDAFQFCWRNSRAHSQRNETTSKENFRQHCADVLQVSSSTVLMNESEDF